MKVLAGNSVHHSTCHENDAVNVFFCDMRSNGKVLVFVAVALRIDNSDWEYNQLHVVLAGEL